MLWPLQARRASVTRSGKNPLLLLGAIIVCLFPRIISQITQSSLHGPVHALLLITVYFYV